MGGDWDNTWDDDGEDTDEDYDHEQPGCEPAKIQPDIEVKAAGKVEEAAISKQSEVYKAGEEAVRISTGDDIGSKKKDEDYFKLQVEAKKQKEDKELSKMTPEQRARKLEEDQQVHIFVMLYVELMFFERYSPKSYKIISP